ncbi:hypothetical protein [Nocardioides limicola]|uniref:hypothetical protein n=1 Tax=Nocardioides limicola TaxID=2803368 RepID=UPI00193C6837|nr:hypothetical protein [Nocardioides sp. DJM-14]
MTSTPVEEEANHPMSTTEDSRAASAVGVTVGDPQLRIAVWVGASCLVLGVLAAVTGALLVGAPAAWGAGIGATMAGGIFVVGALVVYVAARVMPSLALVVALLTYVSQVLLAALIFVQLEGSGVLDDGTVHRAWLAALLVLCTLVWVTVQITSATRSRVPIFDLPEAGAR